MNKLKDKILQYIISGQQAEDKAIDGSILNDPAFDAEEFDLLTEIWDLSDNLKDYKIASKSDAWQNIVEETGINETKQVSLMRRWSVAASIMMLLSAGIYFVLSRDPYTTQLAAVEELMVLPDNTKVTLTPGSSIRFLKPKQFVKSTKREIYLVGEAIFDVEYDPDRPFVVLTEFTAVDVTGTIFRYKEDGIKSEAENMEGQVRFGVNDGSESVILNKGDKASYDGGPIILIKFEEPPPPPPPPTNNLKASELVELLGTIYDSKLVMSSRVKANDAVIKVNLNLPLAELLQSLQDNEQVDIQFSPTGRGNFSMTRLRGTDSGLVEDYSYEQYILGQPFKQPEE